MVTYAVEADRWGLAAILVGRDDPLRQDNGDKTETSKTSGINWSSLLLTVRGGFSTG